MEKIHTTQTLGNYYGFLTSFRMTSQCIFPLSANSEVESIDATLPTEFVGRGRVALHGLRFSSRTSIVAADEGPGIRLHPGHKFCDREPRAGRIRPKLIADSLGQQICVLLKILR